MKLAVFDIDGTLTHTMGVTDALFVRVVSDALGVDSVSRDWSSYPHVTDATGNWFEPACHKLTICGIPYGGIPMATADDSHDRREILSLAIDRAGCSTRVVYFGDRPWDAAAAAALSVGFVAVGDHVPEAKLRLADYSDLAAFWRALEEAT